MKKITQNSTSPKEKRPKTELDAKFLVIVEELMAKRGITKDAAISRELGRSNEFINRIRNGIQSATPEAWDALFAEFPEARDIASNVSDYSISQIIGTNHGTATQNNYSSDQEKSSSKQPDYILTTDTHLLIIELKNSNEQLKSQLADKERIIKLLEQSLNK